MTTLVPSPVWNRIQFLDSLGNICAGGSVHTYAYPSFEQDQTTYATGDTTNLVPNKNPIDLDINGVMPDGFWLVSGVGYNFLLADSNGKPVATQINVVAT